MLTKNASMRNIFLTDDDFDDCLFFSEALQELKDPVKLTVLNDGVKLMEALDNDENILPEIIFLDLNMPKMNGFECLSKIRATDKFNNTSIIIFSTNSNSDIVEKTYSGGANFYICKPHCFTQFKKTIELIMSYDMAVLLQRPLRNDFVISMA